MKSQLVVLFLAFLLKWRGRAERGIKRQVMRLPIGRARLDIASALLFCLGPGSPPTEVSDHLIQRCIQLARHERFPGLYLRSAFPPIGIELFENVLGGNRDFAFLCGKFSRLVPPYTFFGVLVSSCGSFSLSEGMLSSSWVPTSWSICALSCSTPRLF